MSILKKEIGQDLTDMVTGKKLIRRDYRRPGQPEYFYLSKNADGSHNQIDVPDDFGRQWAGKTLPIGDCSIKGITQKFKQLRNEVTDIRSPLKSQSMMINRGVNSIPYVGKPVKYFNRAYDIGKYTALVQETYNQTCRKK